MLSQKVDDFSSLLLSWKFMYFYIFFFQETLHVLKDESFESSVQGNLSHAWTCLCQLRISFISWHWSDLFLFFSYKAYDCIVYLWNKFMDLHLSSGTFPCTHMYYIYSLEARTLYTYSKCTLMGFILCFQKGLNAPLLLYTALQEPLLGLFKFCWKRKCLASESVLPSAIIFPQYTTTIPFWCNCGLCA